MRRRDLMTGLGGAAIVAPAAGHAQRQAMPVIGILIPGSRFEWDRQWLAEAGYVEGENVRLEYRWADGDYDRLPALAADLVSHKVDVIVTNGNGAYAAKTATATIPIVFCSVGDPIRSGLVTNLARPGGNITGFTNWSAALEPKELELISELVPRAATFALLANRKTPYTDLVFIPHMREAARAKGMTLSVQSASTQAELDDAFTAAVLEQADAIIVESDAFYTSRRTQIVALAARHAIPAIYMHTSFSEEGALMVYAVDQTETYHQAVIYAGKILKGARPGDLPVQQPTTFKLIVNLRTARALGLNVPQTILARADQVIE
jgi:putative tryptophan/tyrosine transport system substrate-binding protein